MEETVGRGLHGLALSVRAGGIMLTLASLCSEGWLCDGLG